MTDPSPGIWAGLASQYVEAWGNAAPVVQVAAMIALVIVVAIIAWAWSRKASRTDTGVPVEAFAHVVEEQARQTEALRSAVEGLSEVVHQIRMLLETRTFCPFPSPMCAPGRDDHA